MARPIHHLMRGGRGARGLRSSAPLQSMNLQRFGKAHGALPEFIDDWNPAIYRKVGAAGTLGAALVPLLGDGGALLSYVPAVCMAGYWWQGQRDLAQTSHAIRRNFPVLGNLRYLLESIRPDCTQPYSASLLNVSAMSYGSLSSNAILALSKGAKMGGFYHNTGEGCISTFHREGGADIVWNVGTGYFGCRKSGGGPATFDPDKFVQNATDPQIKMIEIKLSQGAKPAHGGILPKEKITQLIADARGLDFPASHDCDSPPSHSAFTTPTELVDFIGQLCQLSGGKPIGFKLCIGRPEEFMAIVHAMIDRGITPDFITVDGGEGGTGAAPPEFSNSVGTPLREGLSLVNNVLRGAGLRNRITLIASGKVLTGFSVVRNLALGADLCNSARAMMYALGCVQALKCNTNRCPTGVATQDPELMKGLVVPEKADRVANFHQRTVNTACEIIGAMGCTESSQVLPTQMMHRTAIGSEVRSYAEVYPWVAYNCLLDGTGPASLQERWDATADRIGHSSAFIPSRKEMPRRQSLYNLHHSSPPPVPPSGWTSSPTANSEQKAL